jgi:hypothetical protein
MRGVNRDAGTEHLLSNYPCAGLRARLDPLDGSTQGKGPQRFPHTTKVAPVPSTVVSYSHSNEGRERYLHMSVLDHLREAISKGMA